MSDDLAPWLACPSCLGALTPRGPELRCDACGGVVGERSGPLLDFIREPMTAAKGFGPKLMHSRLLARVYQRYWRPLFIAVAGGRLHDLEEELGYLDRALDDAPPGPVVDLSCGPGHAALHLHDSGRFDEVVALDWSLAMLGELQETLARRGIDDMPLVRADVARLPFASASVAGIHAGAALHLWPDPAAAAAEIGRVLRPGAGFIASTFAHRRADNPLERPLRALEDLLQFADTRVFFEDELLGMFRAHGIADLDCYRRGSLILFWGRKR
ncbi:MAG: class I SAM-dependent methyltransferase [Myxococcales bacterium]|nr:class I SAM-dependent methyltransferase [Myxococcales bacterium]